MKKSGVSLETIMNAFLYGIVLAFGMIIPLGIQNIFILNLIFKISINRIKYLTFKLIHIKYIKNK